MTAKVVLQHASRARWLARRRKGITATDAAALLGYHPWKTPLGVWLDKVQPEPDRDPTYAMVRGRALEPLLAAEYARQTGAIIEKPPLLLGHTAEPLFLASLDWLAHTPDTTAALELKTENDHERAREWWDGCTPDYYASQVLWQLAVTGLDTGVIFADVLGRFETRTIHRSLEWESDALPALADWWHRYVATRTPPPLDSLRDYGLLNRVWEPVPGEEVVATDAVLGAVQAFQAMRQRAKEREHTMTGLKTQIRAHMGTATILRHPDTWDKVAKVNKAGALTVSAPTTEREHGE
jgi:putative phage-type endonuclease